jgi:hypothetical protein
MMARITVKVVMLRLWFADPPPFWAAHRLAILTHGFHHHGLSVGDGFAASQGRDMSLAT